MKKEIVTISANFPSNRFEINSSSKIIKATLNNETGNFEVEYYQSPFTDSADVYHFGSVALNELDSMNDYQGYVFYGMFYDKSIDGYLYLFGKQTDRIPAKWN